MQLCLHELLIFFLMFFLTSPKSPCFRAVWCAQVSQELLLLAAQSQSQRLYLKFPPHLISDSHLPESWEKGLEKNPLAKIHFTRPKWLLCERDEKCSLEHFRFCLAWTSPWPSVLAQAGNSSAVLSSLFFTVAWFHSWMKQWTDRNPRQIFLEGEDVK